MTIQLPEDVERSLRLAVESGHFKSEGQAIEAALRDYLPRISSHQHSMTPEMLPESSSEPTPKPYWELAAELRAEIPAEAWDALPKDGAEQHDHYLYGAEKRPK